ncbi:glycoside hydrolase family 2 protein [Thermothelomyces heterothallicus CBS 203.75]
MRAKRAAIALFLAWPGITRAASLVSFPGNTAAIPSWELQSSAEAGTDLEGLSQVGVDTKSWHHIKTSRCTLMGCLIEAGVYNEDQLFYSENLRKVNEMQFLVPWIYRSEFSLHPGPGTHFFLQTHGISSRADIFLNGKRVANSSEQAGSYVGRIYDITKQVHRENALAIQVYPTNYYYDLALGWVDWNPWPADNGTGVWRDVEIKQTGAVMLEPLRVVTHLGSKLGDEPANVTLKAQAHNLENFPVTITATGHIVLDPHSDINQQHHHHHPPITWHRTYTLPPLSTTELALSATIADPQIWWPRQWGGQPLYTAALTVTTRGTTTPSDRSTATFGLRSVEARLNPAYNDTTFHVNSRPFQVLGAGYSPNVFLRAPPRTAAADYTATLQYVLHLGLNTIRLEGKDEHPELYAAADRLGVMVLAGWECCDKWEAWSYNGDLTIDPVPVWDDADYAVARAAMAHEARMLQPHPSLLGFLIGSDFWPDDRATAGYLDALEAADWAAPVLASASTRGYPERTGPGGLKMDGPYDWVPPGYWWDTEPTEERLGAAFGFGSELGAGVGTPELGSLRRFLSEGDLEALWKRPNVSLFHMSRETSQFTTRVIYNAGLWNRWGTPASLEDYLMKAQLMDYEAARAQFDAYTAMWNAERPATGLIYWMLNNAWPSLHWNLWDYYMRPAGSYFGAKAGSRVENVVFDYVRRAVWLVNRSLDKSGKRRVQVDVMDKHGKVLYKHTTITTTVPNTSKNILSLAGPLGNITDVVFLRLVLYDAQGQGHALSRNVYWVAKEPDVLDWDESDWYFTPVTSYSDYTALNSMAQADVTVHNVWRGAGVDVTLENKSKVPAFFVSLTLVDVHGNEVLPVTWEDNYVTLWPGEKLTLRGRPLRADAEPWEVIVRGKNVEGKRVHHR